MEKAYLNNSIKEAFKSMATEKSKKKTSFIDTVIANPLKYLAIIAVAALLVGGIAYLASPKKERNPYRTDYPEVRTTQIGSYAFRVPGEWQIGGSFSYYKDFYLDSSDRVNYSRVCYAILTPAEEMALQQYAEQFWEEIQADWEINGGKVKYTPTTVCETDAIRLEYSGTVTGRNTNGEILILDDKKDGGFLLLTYERVGAAKSAEKDYKKVVDSLHFLDASEEITHDTWLDMNPDTLLDYTFNYTMVEYPGYAVSGVSDAINVYSYDLSDEIIFYFTESITEPHTVDSFWTYDNLLIYRYVGDPETGAIAYTYDSTYPDLRPTNRDWFIKDRVHWAKGKQLYDTTYEANPKEMINKFLDEFAG